MRIRLISRILILPLWIALSIFLNCLMIEAKPIPNGALHYFSALSWVDKFEGQYSAPPFWDLFSNDPDVFSKAISSYRFESTFRNDSAINELILGSLNSDCHFILDQIPGFSDNPISYERCCSLSRTALAMAVLKFQSGDKELAGDILLSLLIFSQRLSKGCGFLFFQTGISTGLDTLSLIQNLQITSLNQTLRKNTLSNISISDAFIEEMDDQFALFVFLRKSSEDKRKILQQFHISKRRKYERFVQDFESLRKDESIEAFSSEFQTFYQSQIRPLSDGTFSKDKFEDYHKRLLASFPNLSATFFPTTVPEMFIKTNKYNSALSRLLQRQ